MKQKVVKGCVYSVTAKTDTVLTDSAGLNRTIKAGSQDTFTAASSEVDVNGNATLVLIKGNFSAAPTSEGGGGGGSSDAGSIDIEPLGEYLYEAWAGALDYDYASKYFQTHDAPAEGACSAVKAGQLFGRNFDWYYNREATYVIHTRTTAVRHASLSVASRVNPKTLDRKVLPFLAKDGMNDAGLCVSMNVVPHGDKGDNSVVLVDGATLTLCTLMIPRYILDNFSVAKEAVEALKQCNLYHPAGTIASGFEHHFLISDAGNTYAVEFVDGAVAVTVLDNTPYLTNFHVSGVTLSDTGEVYTPATQTAERTAYSYNHITKHGAGLERWNILAQETPGVTDAAGLRNLMSSLAYTNLYKPGTSPRWDTELVGLLEGLEVDSPTADFDPVHTAVQEQFERRTRDDDPSIGTWQTVHSCVYDTKAFTLSLVVQEDAATTYGFAIRNSSGDEGGDVYKGEPNTFTAKNTFNGAVELNSAVSFSDAPSLASGLNMATSLESTPGEFTLANYNGDLYWGDTKLNTVAEPFDGHLNANLEIGNASYGEHAEWLLYLGDPRHQGELHEETTGIVCSKGPDVHHTVDDILEALNVQSQFKDIIVAAKVSDYVVKLTAKEAGEGPNAYRFSGEDGSDPEHPVDNPCFGLGSVGIIQTVIGSSTTVSATTYTAERNGDAMLALTDVESKPLMYSPWPISSSAVARSLETKQDKLEFDDYPKYMSSNPVKSSGLYPYPVNVASSGQVVFDTTPDLFPPFEAKPFMHPNKLYIIWDNDLDDRSALIELPDNLMPDYFTTVEMHVFNHQDTPINIKWPSGWHWYDPASDSYKQDDEQHQYSPVLTGNSCMCITVRNSVDRGTYFRPNINIVPFVMADVAYVHPLTTNVAEK